MSRYRGRGPLGGWATAARWLAAIRRRVFDDVRARAAVNWGASTSDVRDLLVILRDEIDLRLPRILGEVNVARSQPAPTVVRWQRRA